MERDSTLLHRRPPPLGGRSMPLGLPNAELPAPAYREQLRQLLCPGIVLCTESGPHLILEILGEGGTAIAVLATPLQLARFKGRGVKPEDFPRSGLYSFLERDPGAVHSWRQSRPALRVLKIALAHHEKEQLLYRAIWEGMVRELDCSEAMNRPATPIVFAAGVNPLLHLVMEYIEGQTLAQILAARYKAGRFTPFRWAYIQEIVERLARAIKSLHDKDIAHGDLKPENVIVLQQSGLGEMALHLLDLGLARYAPPESLVELIQRGLVQNPLEKTVVGRGYTPTHAAPEQLDGRPISAATDIYALGVILYQLLTGSLPFWKGAIAGLYTPQGIVKYRTAIEGPFEPPAHPEFPPQADSTRQLMDLLGTALECDPEKRMCSAGAFADTINEVSRLREQERRSPGPYRPTIRFRVRQRRAERAESNRRAVRVWGFRILFTILLAALVLFAAPHIRRGWQSAWQWLEKVVSVESAPASPPSALSARLEPVRLRFP